MDPRLARTHKVYSIGLEPFPDPISPPPATTPHPHPQTPTPTSTIPFRANPTPTPASASADDPGRRRLPRMDPSAGDATPESKGAKPDEVAMAASSSSLKEAGLSPVVDELDAPLYPLEFHGFSELPVPAASSVKGLSSVVDRPPYPPVFHGFSELPPASSVKGLSSVVDRPPYPPVFHGFSELPPAATSQSEGLSSVPDEVDKPIYPLVFDGFAELPPPLPREADESKENAAASSLEGINVLSENFEEFEDCISNMNRLKRTIGNEECSQLGSPKRRKDSPKQTAMGNKAYLEDINILPEEFRNCEELLNEIEENISKIDSLKRNIGVDDESQLVSPKRTKTDEDGTIWAQSPNEPFRLAATIRGLLRQRNKLHRREAMVGKREATVQSRETRLENRESRLENRETRLENREIRVENREIRSEKMGTTLQETIADLGEKYQAYCSAVAADVADKKDTDPSDHPVKKDSAVAKIFDTVKEKIQAADNYATVGEKMLNIPKRGKEAIQSYEDNKVIVNEGNKKIASKFKGYLGAVTTTALQVARASLAETLLDMIGLGGGGDAGDDNVDGSGETATRDGAGGEDAAAVGGAGGEDAAAVGGAGGLAAATGGGAGGEATGGVVADGVAKGPAAVDAAGGEATVGDAAVDAKDLPGEK